MSEEQGKPTEKWYKKRSNRFALMCLVCLACAGAYIALVATQGTDKYYPSPATQYQANKDLVQKAVTAYTENHSGTLPTLNGTAVINGSVYQIINICPLLTSQGGMLRQISSGIWSGNDSADDNCDGGCGGCRNTSHYIWVVASNGSVLSTCVGDGCKANGQDGYQGIW
jgi:hypothetical protein